MAVVWVTAAFALLAGFVVGILWKGRRDLGIQDQWIAALAHRIESVAVGESQRLAPATHPAASPLVDAGNVLIEGLQRHSDQFEAAFAALQEGLVVVDSEGVIRVINPAASDMLGDGLRRGRKLSEATRQPEILDVVRGARDAVRWSSGVVYESVDGRLLQPHAGGLEESSVALVLRDVTLERQIETMRREFVANVSHELKTPLTAIRGYAETLDDSLADADLKRFVDRILVQCGRLEALLADVMELARLESEEVMQRTERVTVDLRALLDESIEGVRESYPDSRTMIALQAPTVLEYRGYRQFLAQLVGNLIDNAVKHSPDGSRVDVRLAAQDDDILVTVADDGPGISSEHLPHLFERFYRVDQGRARTSGGTGLGLAIVKHAARAHGGVVKVWSRPDQGTHFEVRLPRG